MMSQMREISFLFCGSLLADDIHLSDLPMTSRDHIILVTGPVGYILFFKIIKITVT